MVWHYAPILYAVLCYGLATKPNCRILEIPLETVELENRVTSNITKRQFSGVAFSEPLVNFLTYYVIHLGIGTPAQHVSVIIDTGSSDLWVPHAKYNGGFGPDSSETFVPLEDKFTVRYVKGYARGIWAKDVVRLSDGPQLGGHHFGLATDASSPVMGVLGLGPSNSKTKHPGISFPRMLVEKGIVDNSMFSIFLNDQRSKRGSVTFGGISYDKFTGPLKTIPMTSNTAVQVTLLGISSDKFKMTSVTNVVLDTGTSLMYLPKAYVATIADAFGAYYDESARTYRISKKKLLSPTVPTRILFDVSGAVIAVPKRELFWPIQWFTGMKGDDDYGLTILPNTMSMGYDILGDTFLRSAYVVYDLENRQIMLAQSRSIQVSELSPISKTVHNDTQAIPHSGFPPSVS